MKAVYANLINRTVGSTLAITSLMAPLTAVEGAALIISGITHEQVGYRPHCSSQFGGTTTGTGTSSLLGPVSFEGNDCITPMENSLSFEGKMTFTGLSRDDELFIEYSGFFTPTIYPSIFSLTDSIFTITGGTGSFSKATGSGILSGSQDITTGMGSMQAKGTIVDFRKPTHKNKGKDEDKDKNEGKGKNKLEPQALSLSSRGGQETSALVDSPIDLAALGNPNNGLSSNLPVLGDYYYESQTGQLFFLNALPEPGTLGLLGIGLTSLAVLRRRERPNSATNRRQV